MDRGAWWVIVHGVTKSQKQLSDQHTRTHTHTHTHTHTFHCMDLFIYSPVDRQLSCFQFGPIINKTVMNVRIQTLFICIFFHVSWVPRSGIVGHLINLCLSKNLRNFSKQLYHFTLPTPPPLHFSSVIFGIRFVSFE